MIQVVAGIIQKKDKVLIAKRKEGKHLAGFWEFPGGKIEIGETSEECLKRELKEELGIDVTVGSYFMKNEHSYSEKVICLTAYFCELISGEIKLNDHDDVKWVKRIELLNYRIAPADIPFIDELIKNSRPNLK